MHRPIHPLITVLVLALPIAANAAEPSQSPADADRTGDLAAPARALPMPAYPSPYPVPAPGFPGPGYMQPPFAANPVPPGEPGTQSPVERGGHEGSRAPRALPLTQPGAPMAIRIRRQVTPDAYLLRIEPADGKTADIQVTPSGRTLTISRSSDSRISEERNFDDGRGYVRSFSYSSGSVNRRVRIPPDADMAEMTREESAGEILIRIPRRPRDSAPQTPKHRPRQP